MESKSIETIMNKIESNNKNIAQLVQENNELSKLARNLDNGEYLTISHACKKYDVSYRYLYNFVSSGKIFNYSAGNRILLKSSEVEKVLLRGV